MGLVIRVPLPYSFHIIHLLLKDPLCAYILLTKPHGYF